MAESGDGAVDEDNVVVGTASETEEAVSQRALYFAGPVRRRGLVGLAGLVGLVGLDITTWHS